VRGRNNALEGLSGSVVNLWKGFLFYLKVYDLLVIISYLISEKQLHEKDGRIKYLV